jgi:hypothetical protein
MHVEKISDMNRNELSFIVCSVFEKKSSGNGDDAILLSTTISIDIQDLIKKSPCIWLSVFFLTESFRPQLFT